MTAETIVFLIFAAIALAGALTMVLAANPVNSALGLLATMFSVAVFYVLNDGHFLAAVQVLIYAGAVMTLFLFVIMFIGVDRAQDRSEQLPAQRQLAVGAAALLAVALLGVGSTAWITAGRSGLSSNGTVEAIADALFGRWILAFELTAVLIIIAGAGTIALALYQPRLRAEGDEAAAEEPVIVGEPT